MFISEKVMRRYRQVYIESHHDNTEASQRMLEFIEGRYPGVEQVSLTIPYMVWLKSQGFPDEVMNLKQVILKSNEFSYHTAEEIMNVINETTVTKEPTKILNRGEVSFRSGRVEPRVVPILFIVVIPLIIVTAVILLLI